MNPNLLNGANLAYIGDAYYELCIREHLITNNITNQHQLHKSATKYVSAKGHSLIIKEIYEFLSVEEQTIFKRGRNYKNNSNRKNIDMDDYLNSSGFEALIGYLYLMKNFVRLEEIINLSIKIIEGNHE